MPYVKRSKRSVTTRKRSYVPKRTYKRRPRRPYAGSVPGGLNAKKAISIRPASVQTQTGFLPFAAKYRAKLPWSYWTGLTCPVTGLIGAVTYRLNSPYDPDTGAGGTSAQDFSTLATIYKRYIGYGAKVTLQWSDPNADGLKVGYRIRRADQLTSINMNMPTFLQAPFSRLDSVNGSGSQKKTQTVYVPIQVPWGVRKGRLFDEAEYASAVTTNPANEVYLDLCSVNPSGIAISIGCTVSITYYCIFDERV